MQRLSAALVEHKLRKNFRKQLWTPFIKAIKDYQLIEDGDRIAVAISGGKDSFILAKLFQELYRHGHRNFSLEFLVMDPGYRSEHRAQLEKVAGDLEIPIRVFEAPVFRVSQAKTDKPCYLCARMRRGYLYAKAKELGCNKIALGHHYDDVIETVLMNVLSGGSFMTMMPKLHSTNFSGMELIRPLYYIREKDIIRFSRAIGYDFLNCACVVADGRIDSNRQRIKQLIQTLKTDFPQVEDSLFAATKNVHVGAILGTIEQGEKRSFLDHYKKEK